jgi:hypothetical protein
MSSVFNGMDIEREEVNWLLTSGVMGRSHNLSQMLKFICEKHFDGQTDQITERAIAVEALGRRSDFDPQADTIVRVTAHQLRKRLQEIYQGEGASHPVHVLIPSGQYAPSFVHQNKQIAKSIQPVVSAETALRHFFASFLTPRRRWLVFGTLLVAVVLTSVALRQVNHRKPHPVSPANPTRTINNPAKAANTVASGRAVRVLLGDNRKPYVDHSGFTWTPGNYCTGGSSVSEPNQKVAGTEDPYIFLGGIRGSTHCLFPVDPGIYEVHLLFAENSDLQEATRRVVYSLNGSDDVVTLDIVDDAGGNGIATTKVLRGVRAESDGAIHIDFISEVTLLKAVEILPAPTDAMLPLRIVAGPSSYKDSDGHIWLSDRYFNGGRRGMPPKPGQIFEAGLYGSRRIGHFRYSLPVIPFEKYQVRLYFQESWFGKHNGGAGGPNSRIFDVWCNGAVLLKNFDITREAGSAPTVKTFDHIQATAQGKIELTFTPVVNYALIDAIEVLPETPQK